MVTDMTKQNARIAARRTTTAISVTGDTVRTVRFRSRNLLVTRQSCCAFVTVVRYGYGMLGGPVALVAWSGNPALASFARPLELSLVDNQ